MKRYDKLIFVSNGDTCRAPMAEAVLKSKYLLEELEILSKGLVVLFPEPVNPKAEAVLAGHGLDMSSHAAEQFAQSDLLTEYIGESGDITNPMGGTMEDYEACYQEMEKLISSLVIELNEEELLC